MTLDELFSEACECGMPTSWYGAWLRWLASSCTTVVELGTGDGVSTSALLAGQPAVLHTIDVVECPLLPKLKACAGRTLFRWSLENSLEAAPQQCDFLFIDTIHTGQQIYAELFRHGPLVSRWIAIHDTDYFAWWDELLKAPGLWLGIWRWLKDHPEWRIAEVHRESYGMTLLQRLDCPPILGKPG